MEVYSVIQYVLTYVHVNKNNIKKNLNSHLTTLVKVKNIFSNSQFIIYLLISIQIVQSNNNLNF